MTSTSRTPTPSGEVNRRASAPSGVAIIDKPSGWTSHQVVGRLRRIAGTRKVGHAGTLDPMATGVLVVGVERATRLLGHLALTDKTYAATVRLGITTVTDDAEGDVVVAAGAEGISAARVEHELAAFRGDILQVPSAVSAIQVDGVRSYARVRSGEEVVLPPRRVTITELDVLDCRPAQAEQTPVIDVDVTLTCSSGTYVRALARDLGAALGTGGHLTSLRRTRVGPFGIEQAQALESTAEHLTLLSLSAVARRCFPVHTLNDSQAQAVRHGRRLPDLALPGPMTALMTPEGEFLALYRPGEAGAVPVSVFVG